MKRATLTRFMGGLAVLWALLPGGRSAWALTGVWAGSSGDWNNTARWGGDHVVNSTEEALLAWGRTLTVQSACPDVGAVKFVKNVWGARLDVAPAGSLRVLGDLYVQDLSTDTNYVLNVQGGALTVDGNLSMRTLALTSGTLDLTDGTLNAYGSFTLSGGTLRNAATISIGGASPGNLTQSGGTLERSSASGTTSLGAYTLNGEAEALVSGGTLSVAGGISNLAATGQSVLRVEGGALNLNSKAATVGQLAFRSGTISNVGAAGFTLNGTGDALVLRNTTVGFNVTLSGASGGDIVFESENNGTGVLSGALDLGGLERAADVADGTAAEDLRLSGPVANGGLAKSGAGTLCLAGVSTYSGVTRIHAGTLLGGTSGTCPNSALCVADGATNGVKALTYGGQWACAGLAYAGGAGLVFDLANVPVSSALAPLQVNGDLSVTGTVAVAVRGGYWPSVGTYPLVSYTGTLGGPGALVLAELPEYVVATLVNNTGAKRLDLSVTAAPDYAQPVSVWTKLDGGNAGGLWGTSANWSGGVPNAADAVADFGTLDITATSTVTNEAPRTVGALRFGDTTASHDWVVTNAALALATTVGLPVVAVSNRTATLHTVLTGTQGLIKKGAGTLALAAVNTFSGGTVVDGGTLQLSASAAAVRGTVTVNSGGTLSIAGAAWQGFGSTAGQKIDTLKLNGGTLNNTLGTAMITDAAVSMTAGSWTGSVCWWRNTAISTFASASPSTFAGDINFYLAYTDAPLVVTVADGPAAADLLISGAIKENAAAGKSGKIVKQGAGTLVLSGANTYTGPTTINEGVLMLGSGGTVGKLATTGAITNHATLVFNRSNALTQGTDFSAGAICGAGGIVQAGAGTTTLNAANAFSGAIVVTNGVLRLAQATALTATNDVYLVTTSGAKLDLPAAGTTFIRRLYVDGVLKVKDRAYGPANLPSALSGSADAYLLTTDGETAKGTLITVQ